jgi:hypothetical protein
VSSGTDEIDGRAQLSHARAFDRVAFGALGVEVHCASRCRSQHVPVTKSFQREDCGTTQARFRLVERRERTTITSAKRCRLDGDFWMPPPTRNRGDEPAGMWSTMVAKR